MKEYIYISLLFLHLCNRNSISCTCRFLCFLLKTFYNVPWKFCFLLKAFHCKWKSTRNFEHNNNYSYVFYFYVASQVKEYVTPEKLDFFLNFFQELAVLTSFSLAVRVHYYVFYFYVPWQVKEYVTPEKLDFFLNLTSVKGWLFFTRRLFQWM